MNLRKISIALLTLLLAAMATVPMVSAATATQEQLDKMNELQGKDITVGEFYTVIDPEIFVDMPADVKAKLFETKYDWSISSGKETKAQSMSSLLSSGITATTHLNSAGTTIIFWGHGGMNSGSPAGYIHVATTLRNSGGSQVGFVYNYGYNTVGVTTPVDSKTVPAGTYTAKTVAYSMTPDYDDDDTWTITV